LIPEINSREQSAICNKDYDNERARISDEKQVLPGLQGVWRKINM